ncbi:MAG: outer membrane lipid asymmetry maintenance protein MlaD [Syntrophaceae bacterium]|nr:outer membrane lipid asymmetry maintenance protein MlaD [Syntrophaceae bacterium]
MKKYKMEAVVGIFVFLGLLCIGYMTVKLGNVSFLEDDSYPIEAKFLSVTGLRIDSSVKALGIEVGKVKKITMDQESQKAVVKMRIKKGVKIYDDAIASIKTEGLMGDKYVSIDLGGGGSLIEANGTIVETQAPLDIEGLISKYAFGDVKKQ